jgi:hypothetical protein
MQKTNAGHWCPNVESVHGTLLWQECSLPWVNTEAGFAAVIQLTGSGEIYNSRRRPRSSVAPRSGRCHRGGPQLAVPEPGRQKGVEPGGHQAVMLEPARWHCYGAPALPRSRWPRSPRRMNNISCGYRFSPEIIHQAIWLALSRYRNDDAKRDCRATLQAAATTSRHVVIAAARSKR